MNTATDTFLLLWGGAVSPAATSRVMYWAVNNQGKLCGIIMPAKVWDGVTKTLKTSLQSPYISVAVTDLSTDRPELRLITINPDTLYDFCHLKSIIYRFRQTPTKLKLEPGKVMAHLGLVDSPPLAKLQRGDKPDKGEFFTFLPDKTRLDLFYLVEKGLQPPAKLDVVVMWGLKGFSLPQFSRDSGHNPAEHEKLILERTEIKPQPLWLRRLLGIGRRQRRRRQFIE